MAAGSGKRQHAFRPGTTPTSFQDGPSFAQLFMHTALVDENFNAC